MGSTTSTRGSLMATSLMQDMSKPYTFSHPGQAGGSVSPWVPGPGLPPPPPPAPRPLLTVDLVVFILPVLDGRHVQRGSVWEDEAVGCLRRGRSRGEDVKGGRALAAPCPHLAGLVSSSPRGPWPGLSLQSQSPPGLRQWPLPSSVAHGRPGAPTSDPLLQGSSEPSLAPLRGKPDSHGVHKAL